MKDKLQFPFKRKGGNYLELLEDLGEDTMLGVKTVRATTRNTAIYFDDDGYTIQDAKKLARAIQDTYSDVTATADFGRNPYGEEVPFVFVDKANSFMRESKMKKLNITKEAFEKSKYFTKKYGKLEYVSESGKVFKTNKGKILKFKESSKKFGKKFTKENVDKDTNIEELYEELKVKYGIKKPRYLDNDTFLEMDGGQILCGLDRSGFPGVRTYTKANNQFCQELVEWMKQNHPDFEVEWEPGDVKTGKNEPVLIYKPRRMLEKFSKKFKESVGDVSTDPAYVCPYCGSRNCEFDDAEDLGSGLQEGYFEGATFNAQFWCNECNKPYNVQFELKVKDVYPNEDADELSDDWA